MIILIRFFSHKEVHFSLCKRPVPNQFNTPSDQQSPLHQVLCELIGWKKFPQRTNHRQASVPFTSRGIVHQNLFGKYAGTLKRGSTPTMKWRKTAHKPLSVGSKHRPAQDRWSPSLWAPWPAPRTDPRTAEGLTAALSCRVSRCKRCLPGKPTCTAN